MPSETVYVKDEAYSYAVQTKSEDQSVGKRLQELIEAGIENEDDEVPHP